MSRRARSVLISIALTACGDARDLPPMPEAPRAIAPAVRPVLVERCPLGGERTDACFLSDEQRTSERVELGFQRDWAFRRYRGVSEHRKRALWKRRDVGAVVVVAMLQVAMAEQIVHAPRAAELDDQALIDQRLQYELATEAMFAQRLDEFLARYRSGGGTP